jgi:hypothetical protein
VKSKIKAMATITATIANVESIKTSRFEALRFYKVREKRHQPLLNINNHE